MPVHPKDASRRKRLRHLALGTVSLGLGVLLLWKQTGFFLPAVSVLALLILLGGIARLWNWAAQKPRKPQELFLGLICLLLGGVMARFPSVTLYAAPFLFSAYLMLNGIVKLVDTALSMKERSEELIFCLIPAAFYLTFAGILLFLPQAHVRAVLICAGIYCLLLGGTYILDYVHSRIPAARRGLRRRLRIGLPALFSALIPHSVLLRLNGFLSQGREPEEFEDLVGGKSGEKPDLELFIHVSATHPFMAIGHCDIWFDGELIAYGNYDEAAQRPLGMGPGVLLISNKYDYIPFCLEFNQTTIFSFGLRLNPAQKSAVRARIREIKEQLLPWDPEELPANRKRFAARLQREQGARFYKFRSGRFGTYFVMSANCALMADWILSAAGTDILTLNGSLSPGAIYDYLEAEFLKKGSMVVSRNVYRLPLTARQLREQDRALRPGKDLR